MTKIKIGKRELRQWVKALRSGDYEQTASALCKNKSEDPDKQEFCCLGVACDLFLDAYWHEVAGDMRSRWTMHGEHGMPPDPLRNALDEALPKLGSRKGKAACSELANRNDNGRSFKQIATAIEKAAGL